MLDPSQRRRAAAEQADGEHAARLCGDLVHARAVHRCERHRLFDEDVDAAAHQIHRDRRVELMGQSDDRRVGLADHLVIIGDDRDVELPRHLLAAGRRRFDQQRRRSTG